MAYICSECGKSFNARPSLLQHEKRHKNLAPYVCCGKMFFSKANIERHQCNAHGETKSHVCPTCGKAFAIMADLTRHRRKEDKSDFLPCSICGYKAPSATYLRDHMSKHETTSSFKCQQCSKAYKFRSGLARHVAKEHS